MSTIYVEDPFQKRPGYGTFLLSCRSVGGPREGQDATLSRREAASGEPDENVTFFDSKELYRTKMMRDHDV